MCACMLYEPSIDSDLVPIYVFCCLVDSYPIKYPSMGRVIPKKSDRFKMPMSQPITTLLRSDRLNFSHHPKQMPSKQRSLRDASDVFQSMSERSKTTGLPLVMTNIAIDNGLRTSELFHSFLCVYQRVQDMLPSSIPKPQQTSEATNHLYTKNKSRINIYN